MLIIKLTYIYSNIILSIQTISWKQEGIITLYSHNHCNWTAMKSHYIKAKLLQILTRDNSDLIHDGEHTLLFDIKYWINSTLKLSYVVLIPPDKLARWYALIFFNMKYLPLTRSDTTDGLTCNTRSTLSHTIWGQHNECRNLWKAKLLTNTMYCILSLLFIIQTWPKSEAICYSQVAEGTGTPFINRD